jgi:ABC-2 type transport system permease protein
MAPLNTELAEQQFTAVAGIRWAMVKHSLKNLSGELNVIARILSIAFYGTFGLAAAAACGTIAFLTTRDGTPEVIAAMIWILSGFWQMFPLLRAGYSNTFDPSMLLRFPLTYRTYFYLRLFYGALEPVALVGVLGLLGIAAGVGIAAPQLLAWCAVGIAIILVLNILLTQLLLSWVERWLAQRRTREIFGTILFLAILSMQLVGPLTQRWTAAHKRNPNAPPPVSEVTAMRAVWLERLSPPGMAAYSVAVAQKKNYLRATAAVAGLGLYLAGVVLLLDVRLKRQYRGENLSEAARRQQVALKSPVHKGWQIPWLTGVAAAMFEKEIRYLLRSGPMLLSFIMPIFVLLIFGGTSGRRLPTQMAGLSFPMATAYSLLILTNVVYNTFGGDHAGVQFYFMSPVPMRKVIAAKNIVHASIFLTEIALVWLAVAVLREIPTWWVTAATLAAIPFALGVEFAAGNILSVYTPKKLEFQMMGRQRTPQMSALLALVVHAVVIACSFVAFVGAIRYGIKVALPAFLLLDVLGAAVYLFALRKADAMALNRRELMFQALCRE